MINFVGNRVEFLLPSWLPLTTVGLREIVHKFTIINLINCILWLWVRTPESLCQFHCLHWSLESLFQILAFRHFLSDPLLFAYSVPKPPCHCNWKQARRRLDGSDEWKRDLDPSTHNPLAGVQARLWWGWKVITIWWLDNGLREVSLVSVVWPPRDRCSCRSSTSSGTSPGSGWTRDANAALFLSSGGCPLVTRGNPGFGFGFKASK